MCVAYSSGDHTLAEGRWRSLVLPAACSSALVYAAPMLATTVLALSVLTEENQKPHSAQRWASPRSWP